MKRILALASLFFALSTPVMANDEVPAPNINVGTNWTFEKVDGYSNNVQSTWKNVVEQKNDTHYSITRYSDQGAIVFKYKITKNLGQGSPTRTGKIGNGDLYKFPFGIGSKWTYVNYWTTPAGENGYDEIVFTVTAKETLTTKAGTFSVFKVEGSGQWLNESSRSGAGIEITLYYSPDAQTTIRSERVQQMPAVWRVPPTRDRIDLIAYELK